MKLIGSKMESDFREELVSSNEFYFLKNSRLKVVLESHGYPTKNAYVLHWVPDQTEDFYTVLINGEYLVSTEIDHFDTSINPVFEHLELKVYLKGLSRMHQVKLAVAKNLASEKT